MSSPLGRTLKVLVVFVAAFCLFAPMGYAQVCADPVDTTGTIDFFNPDFPNAIGVEGVFYLVNPDTLFQSAEGTNISPGDFRVGDVVMVEGCRDGVALPMARVVRHVAPPGEDLPDPVEVQVEGEITSIHYETGNLVVNGTVEVLTDDLTEIVDENQDPLPFGDLGVGDRVWVVGVESSDAPAKTLLPRVLATHIQRLEQAPEPDPDQVEVSGKVTSIHNDHAKLVLDFRTYVYTDDETEIVDSHGSPISFGDIQLKDLVTVHGFELTEDKHEDEIRRIQATRVQVIEHSEPDTVEFDGKITRIDSRNKAIYMGDRKIRTNDETRLQNHAGDPIGFDAFHVGEKIHVVAYADKTFQTVLAILIKKKDAPTPISFSGRIGSINPDDGSMVVNDRKVKTNDLTEFFNNHGDPLSLADFKVGERVEVEGYESPSDKTLTPILATRIQKQQGELDNIVFEGEIVEINKGDKTLKVGDRRVIVTEDTVFQNEDGVPIGFGDLERGDRVRVEGYVLKTVGTVVAEEITLLEAGPPEGDPLVEGVLRAFVVREKLLVVDHTLVEYNESTEFLDHEGHSIRVKDLRKGDKLKVFGERLPDYSVLAHVIVRARRHGDECEQKVKGVITEIDAASKTLVVDMLLFQVDDETQILGMENVLIDFADLAVGDGVEVIFCPDSAVPPIADKIRVKKRESHETKVQGFVIKVDLDNMALVVSGDYGDVTGVDQMALAVNGDYETVTGVYVRTDERTDLRDERGHRISLADFNVLDLVRAKGMPLPDGSLDASQVRKLKIHEDCDGKVRGFLADLDLEGGTLVVGIVEVRTSANTKIVDQHGNRTELMDLEIGACLEVHYCEGIGTPVARLIKIRAHDDYDFEDDGEVGHNDAVRYMRDRHHGRYHLDLNGDGINTHRDLFLFGHGWGRGNRR